MKKVLVTGAFDGLHQGHIDFFKQAKALGDHLTVIVARDKTIKNVKEREPNNVEQQRLNSVNVIDIVDEALLGHFTDPYQSVVDCNPDILALGYDQNIFTEKIEQELQKRGVSPK